MQLTVLQLCDTDNGMTSLELWEAEPLTPVTKKYKRGTLMDVVHTLKRMKLLKDHGKTKGNIYFTTDKGKREIRELKRSMNGTKLE